MDVVNAFTSTEKFLAFFNQADKAILEHQKNYQVREFLFKSLLLFARLVLKHQNNTYFS